MLNKYMEPLTFIKETHKPYIGPIDTTIKDNEGKDYYQIGIENGVFKGNVCKKCYDYLMKDCKYVMYCGSAKFYCELCKENVVRECYYVIRNIRDILKFFVKGNYVKVLKKQRYEPLRQILTIQPFKEQILYIIDNYPLNPKNGFIQYNNVYLNKIHVAIIHCCCNELTYNDIRTLMLENVDIDILSIDSKVINEHHNELDILVYEINDIISLKNYISVMRKFKLSISIIITVLNCLHRIIKDCDFVDKCIGYRLIFKELYEIDKIALIEYSHHMIEEDREHFDMFMDSF